MKAASIVSLIREILAVTLWTFICLKIFVFDVEIVLVEFFTPHKLLGLVVIIIFLWLLLGTARFRSFVAYILFYPLAILLWLLDKIILHDWATIVLFSPVIYSILTTLDRRLIIGSFALLGAVVMLFSTNPIIVGTAMLVLFLVLCEHYSRRFASAFQPSSIFVDMRNYVRRLWQETLEPLIAKQVQQAAAMNPASDDYKKKRLEDIQVLFILDLAFDFVAVKLRDVANSRKIDLYFILSLLYTFAFTVIVFALEYRALFTLDPESFVAAQGTSFWLFLVFSFNTLMTADLGLIKAQTPMAILLVNLELFTGLLILIIFVFVLLTIVRERYHEELRFLIEEIRGRADAIEGVMEKQYHVPMTNAWAPVLAANPLLSKVNMFLRGLKASSLDSDSRESGSNPKV